MCGALGRFRGPEVSDGGWQPWSARAPACPRDASLPIDDPNEQTNRRILAVNQALLDPVANVVKAVTPGPF